MVERIPDRATIQAGIGSIPNALLAEGLQVLENWGFTYKANLVWAKRRKDGGPDGRGVAADFPAGFLSGRFASAGRGARSGS